MTMELESMAVEMPEVDGHPNRAGFRGVLTLVDVPSQRAPSGSGGRRVVLTRSAAEAALPSLLGMALDFAPTFDRHDVRRKVGVITSAEVVGRDLQVGGYLYAKDFPEIVEEVAKFGRRPREVVASKRRGMAMVGARSEGIRLRASLSAAVERLRSLTAGVRRNATALQCQGRGAGLGMSFEVTDALLADRRSKIWTLVGVTFTGAAVLRKDKAAFEDTWIELA
jgi:hypothetical protein